MYEESKIQDILLKACKVDFFFAHRVLFFFESSLSYIQKDSIAYIKSQDILSKLDEIAQFGTL